ncbi:hypothetical protein [Nitrosomonas sp. sh817]|uniref:hypothetical protein n=1 Tax=unclassified Nitrosomonas TaxID=2609265 RepID=UPI0027DD7F67|nr:hypothetical protein [Nitrosomonas sp. sh817]WMJ09963.1 hypothetical protein RBH92_07115 [Nitrosomonas sp. sh817]
MGMTLLAFVEELEADDDVSTDFSPSLSQAARPIMNTADNKVIPDFFLNCFVDFIKRLSFVDYSIP